MLTAPPACPEPLLRALIEHAYESWGVRSLLMATPMTCALWAQAAATNDPTWLRCAVVLDSGYSFTHAAPYWDSTRLTYATRRLDLAGKVLTNALKEQLSQRQWNLMDETGLVNRVKERLCFVSEDFDRDMARTRMRGPGGLRRQYVLPSDREGSVGWVLEEDEPLGPADPTLNMGPERLLPELLFRPNDLGLQQGGVAETLVQALQAAPEDLWAPLSRRILVTGGNTKFKGFLPRLHAEARSLLPDDMDLNIAMAANPIEAAWSGGCHLVGSPLWEAHKVRKAEFDESGWLLAFRRFQPF